MNSPKQPAIDNLLDQLNLCRQLRFNGNLDVQDPDGHTWIFYYRLGRIVWATGGIHPVRRFYRQLIQHCPQVNVKKLKLSQEILDSNSWDYHVLTLLNERQQLKPEQVTAVVETTITELLFEVIQQSVFSPLICDHNQDEVLDVPLTLSSSDMLLQQAQHDWQEWQKAGLTKLSPNLAPKLVKPKELEQQANPRIYQNFVKLLTGRSSIRDLAIKMKQDPLKLTRSLLPYIKKGQVKGVQIPDLPLPTTESSSSRPSKVSPAKKNSIPALIACVDDSPQVSEILEKILTPTGYRFLGIQDSVQAVPLLLEQKPSLIFLDLIMPVANGYEICSQLRRISVFSEVPIIILTGSDGIVDRVRAKMVGATGFMSKPIEANKVLAVAKKYTSSSSPS